MAFDTFTRRITRLWAAALNLEQAAIRALEHLPPAEKKELQKALSVFRMTAEQIHNRKSNS